MAVSTRSVALCLALFLALVKVGSCVQCYHCTSQSDIHCGKALESQNLKPIDCSKDESTAFNRLNLYNILPAEAFGSTAGAKKYCHKLVMETGTVIRTCLEGAAADKESSCSQLKDLSKTATPDKKVNSCMVCDKDMCNSAGALSLSLPLSALALVISYLLYKQ